MRIVLVADAEQGDFRTEAPLFQGRFVANRRPDLSQESRTSGPLEGATLYFVQSVSLKKDCRWAVLRSMGGVKGCACWSTLVSGVLLDSGNESIPEEGKTVIRPSGRTNLSGATGRQKGLMLLLPTKWVQRLCAVSSISSISRDDVPSTRRQYSSQLGNFSRYSCWSRTCRRAPAVSMNVSSPRSRLASAWSNLRTSKDERLRSLLIAFLYGGCPVRSNAFRGDVRSDRAGDCPYRTVRTDWIGPPFHR